MESFNFKKLLIVFILFITGMIACRFIYYSNLRYIFLLWNLFLAWIPFQLSLFLETERPWKNWQATALLGCWLLFFPNSLYVVTDLIHLEEKAIVPLWYDAILLFTAALMGLLMAFASLLKVESFLAKRFSKPMTGSLIIFALFSGSFGVYLGRFLRWNSWDLVANPIDLSKDIAVRLIFPLEYYRTWATTIIFTCFFYLLYLAIKHFTVYGSRLRETILLEE